MKTLFLEFSYKQEKMKSTITAPSFIWNWKSKTLDKVDKKIEVFKNKSGNDSERIKNWIKKYKSYFDFEISKEESSSLGIAIEFDNNIEKDIVNSLEENRIRYTNI